MHTAHRPATTGDRLPAGLLTALFLLLVGSPAAAGSQASARDAAAPGTVPSEPGSMSQDVRLEATGATHLPEGFAGGTRRVTVGPGPGHDHRSISAALAAASAGDTVVVAAGTYRERLRVSKPVVLLGRGRPVVDAGRGGHVVEATAPLVIRGFELRSSGKSVDEEHAGVMVRGARAVVTDNVLRDVFYGVYLKDAPGSVVEGNRITGKDLPLPRRGDGIRLWYSSRARVTGNAVRRTRDVVVYFSDSLVVRDNEITDGRYGLHYMYSDHNVFRRNRFSRNQVGAFIMYSRDVTLARNVFADARGASGMGLGLKDADEIVAEGNLFVDNESGIYLDNSPRSAGTSNHFSGNLLVQNGSAVRMLPSVAGNVFAGNSFVGNRRPARVSGGAGRNQAAQNRWAGNHWGGYQGFDRNGDGVGDTPFVHARLSDDLVSRHPALELFAYSPVMPVLETVSRLFPVLKPRPVVVDSQPRTGSSLLSRWRSAPPVGEPGPPRAGAPTVLAGGLWTALAAVAGGLAWGLGRRRTS